MQMPIAVRPLTDALSVTAQITTADVADIAELGFKSLICNRPDGESPDQTGFAEIAREAAKHGLKAVHQPVVSGQIVPADGAVFGDHLAALPKPILAYCRSGARSTSLAMMAGG
jgi:sulfide:quinone oxidoreductase